MKIKWVLAAVLILVLCLPVGFSGCGESEGPLPQFAVGDTWVSRWNTEGYEYIVTSEITGSVMVDGKDCWVMETTFDPPYQNLISGLTNKYEKTDLNIVFSDYHYLTPGKFTTFTYQVEGDPYYPLKVGNQATEIEYQTITDGDETVTQTSDTIVTTRTEVEKIEDITTEAGTFRCFKVLKYDSNGNLISVSWRSNKTKLFQVKMIDMTEEDAKYELISYSMK